MSYENAEPKILKTLNSSGQVLNDSGEVMENTSDYWKKLYDQAEPKPDKILLSDGTIKDSAGNLIQDTTEYNLKKYNQAEPIPAKYLHSDGTIDENPGSGGADLDNNVAKTIDVSTYTEPVEITPTTGKDGMKKATVTLSNIPSGGSVTAYGWVDESGNTLFFNFAVAPTDKESFNMGKNLVFSSSSDAQVSANNLIKNINYTKDSDTQFSTTDTAPKPGPDKTYTRDPTKDFTLWQVNE